MSLTEIDNIQTTNIYGVGFQYNLTPGWAEPDGKMANQAELWLVMTLTEELVQTRTDTNGNETTQTIPAGTIILNQPIDMYTVTAP